MRHYDGPPRTFQEVKRLNRVLLDAFYSLGKSRYTDGRVEWAQTQSKMRANRSAFERYAVKHYPQWTHPEMMRQLWRARSAYIASPCEPTLDVLCHVQYNLWHTDFIETYEQADAGKLDLSDPFSGLRKVVESARDTLAAWQDVKKNNPQAKVGRWVNGSNVSVAVDEMIEDAEEDVATAEGQLATALGEPDPLPAPVVVQPAPSRAAHAAVARHQASVAVETATRKAKIVDAVETFEGAMTKRGRPRLKELRIHAGIPDITRAERNSVWDSYWRE